MESASRKTNDILKSAPQDTSDITSPAYIHLSSGSFHEEIEVQGGTFVNETFSLQPKFFQSSDSKSTQPYPILANFPPNNTGARLPRGNSSPNITFSFAPDDTHKAKPRNSKTFKGNILDLPLDNSDVQALKSEDPLWDERARTPMEKKGTRIDSQSLSDNFAAALVARMKIKGAFDNAAENRVFDASNEELGLINDKCYVIDQREIDTKQRSNSLKKRKGAARLRQILEKHGIISENLGKKKKKKGVKRVEEETFAESCKRTLKNMKKGFRAAKKSLNDWYIRQKYFFYELFVLSYINPQGKFRVAWDFFCLGLIFYDLVAVPYIICFDIESNEPLTAIDTFKDSFFAVDIVLNFKTAYLVDATLVTDYKLIAAKYLKKWFVLDVITTIPVSTIVEFIYTDGTYSTRVSALKLLRFLRFLRVAKVFRAMKLKKLFVRMEEFFYSSVYTGIKSLISLFFSIALVAHYVACAWYLVGSIVDESDGDSWIRRYGLIGYPNWDKYIASLYWAIMTMMTVGYGDINPVSTSERTFNIFVMLLGCAIFGYSMNSIGSVVQSIQAGVSKTRQMYYNLSKYMDQKNVSRNIRTKVIHYLDYMIETQKHGKVVEEQLFSILSDSIKNELKKDVNGQVLRENALLQKNFGTKFRGILSNSLEEKIFSPGETIFDETDRTSNLYFIAAGVVELYYSDCNVTIKKIEREFHFGEMSFFTGNTRTAAARSSTFTDLFYIKREIFLSLLEEYPNDKEMFHFIKDKLLLYNQYEALEVKCFLCGQESHVSKDCHRVHYIPDKEQILTKYNTNNSNFMRLYKRNGVRNKYHSKRMLPTLQMKAKNYCQLNPNEVTKFLRNNFGSSFFNLVKEAKEKMLEDDKSGSPTPGHHKKAKTDGPKENQGHSSLLSDDDESQKSSEREPPKKDKVKKSITNKVKFADKVEKRSFIEESEESHFEDGKASPSRGRAKFMKLKSKILKQAEENIRLKRELAKSKGEIGSEEDEDDDYDEDDSELNRQAVKISAPRKSKLYRGTTVIQMSRGSGVGGLLLEVNGVKLGIGEGNVLNLKNSSETYVFETICNYQLYFPHNNFTKILEHLNALRIAKRNAQLEKEGKLFPRRRERVESENQKTEKKSGLLEVIASKARKSIMMAISPIHLGGGKESSFFGGGKNEESMPFFKKAS